MRTTCLCLWVASLAILVACNSCVAPPQRLGGDLRTTDKIEILLRAQGQGWVVAATITDPDEVSRIVEVFLKSLDALAMPAGWKWTNRVDFVLRDGRRIETSIGLTPDLVGVRGQTVSGDYELSTDLRAAMEPWLAQAEKNLAER